MPDSKKSKDNGLKPKIEQKLILTNKEKIYIEVLEAPTYLLLEKYGQREISIEIEDSYYPIHKDLHQQLDMMIPFLGLEDEDEKIAEYVIYNIDSKGKLRVSAQEVAQKFGVSVEKAREIIDTIYEAFSEEINQLSSEDEENYILPDVAIMPDYVEVRKIEVKDPVVMKAIEMREETLRKICEIVRKINEPFLRGYRKYPHVVTMKYVANLVGLHVSTVSRAVNRKYVNTPIGVLPLRIFFGRLLNPKLVMNEIKELLKIDSKLTDKQLVILLKSLGINISRRTVNKYRNLLDNLG